MELYRENGMSYITKEYGPLHMVFIATIFIDFVAGIILVIYCMRKKNEASFRSKLLLLFMLELSIIAFFGGRYITKKYDTIPISYILFQAMIFIIEMRGELYNFDDLISRFLLERKELGYIAFDRKLYFLGADDTIKTWFPEIKEFRIDRKIGPENNRITELAASCHLIDENGGNYERIVRSDANFYKIRGGYIFIGSVRMGYNFYIEDVTLEQEMFLKTIHEKEHDAMTGLFNKGKYMELMGDAYKRLDSIAIFNMDVNNLKKMNDTYGHEAGDALIIKAARSVLSIQRDNVKGFRIGGDEFMVVAENATKEEADALLLEWQQSVKRLNEEDDGINIVIACGTAYGEKNYDLNELLQIADNNMYVNKRALKEMS